MAFLFRAYNASSTITLLQNYTTGIQTTKGYRRFRQSLEFSLQHYVFNSWTTNFMVGIQYSGLVSYFPLPQVSHFSFFRGIYFPKYFGVGHFKDRENEFKIILFDYAIFNKGCQQDSYGVGRRVPGLGSK